MVVGRVQFGGRRWWSVVAGGRAGGGADLSWGGGGGGGEKAGSSGALLIQRQPRIARLSHAAQGQRLYAACKRIALARLAGVESMCRGVVWLGS